MKKASALLLLLLTGCATQGTAMLQGAEEVRGCWRVVGEFGE